MQTLKQLGERLGVINVEKARQGLYISRPVLNGQAWEAWAKGMGMPNVMPGDKMHVTIAASRQNIQTPPAKGIITIYTDRVVIVGLGADAKVIAVAFDDCCLWERNWFLQTAGCTSDWPEYRPHMSLSMDAGGFEIPDSAWASMPPAIQLGPEVFGPFDPAEAAAESDNDNEMTEAPDNEETEIAASILTQSVKHGALSPLDMMTLRDLSAGRKVLKSSVASVEKALATPASDLLPAVDLGKSIDHIDIPITKGDECTQTVYGWASVMTKDGTEVVDLQGDAVTEKALRNLCKQLLTTKAGNVSHEGAVIGEITEAVVITKDVQKAWGVEMDREGLWIGMHLPDKGLYEQTGIGKTYQMFSIGCRARMETT